MRHRLLIVVGAIVSLALTANGCNDPDPDDTDQTAHAHLVTFPGVVNDHWRSSEHCYYDADEVLLRPVTGDGPIDPETIDLIEREIGVALTERDTVADAVTRVTVADDDPLTVADRITATGLARAAPNYVLAFSPEWKFSPGGSARRSSAPPIARRMTRGGVVVVLDTGFDPAAWPLALGTAPDWSTGSVADEVRFGPVAGHGTFVAGIVARFAPGVRVVAARPANILRSRPDPGGFVYPAVTDVEVAKAIAALQVPSGDPVDVLNLSLGTYACSDVPVQAAGGEDAVREPIATRTALARLVDEQRTMVVTAAAGNDEHGNVGPHGGPGPRYYPAAWAVDPEFAGRVVSVGTNASFSNHADWVVTSATGTLVSHRSVQEAPGALAAGWYEWDGTSFAAACLAARIVTARGTRASARDAWAAMAGTSGAGARVFGGAPIEHLHFTCPA